MTTEPPRALPSVSARHRYFAAGAAVASELEAAGAADAAAAGAGLCQVGRA